VLNLSGLVALFPQPVGDVVGRKSRRRDHLDLDLAASGIQAGFFQFILDGWLQMLDHSTLTLRAVLEPNVTKLFTPLIYECSYLASVYPCKTFQLV